MGFVPTADPEAARETLLELMGQGFAGLDCYDPDVFVVDCPEPFRTEGEDALDDLGAYFLRSRGAHVEARLPYRVYLDLGLDAKDAPRLTVPLASRRLGVVA